jgi:hypothetical protein
MTTTLFVVIFDSPDRKQLASRLAKTFKMKKLGDDCHILNNVCVLRSEKPIDEIYDHMLGALGEKEVVMIAPMADKWRTNMKSDDECFQW